MVVFVLLLPALIVSVVSVLNCVAVAYDTISAIPISVAFKMLAIWIFISIPLSVVGTIFGRHWSTKYTPPCRVNSIPRFNYADHDYEVIAIFEFHPICHVLSIMIDIV
jgi:hypothetical protein